MFDIDTSKPVLVTGATGFVAGWVVKGLLEAGCTVHAAVRDPSKADKIKHLDEIAANSTGEIRYFAADLLNDGSYDEAIAGCGVVFHTASPFTVDVKDPQKELVDPAVNGTINVLHAANKTDSVERVVLTSSCAAIYGDNADVAKAPNGRLDESVWNTSSNLSHNAYSFSKTEAEKAAWEIAKSQDRWKLVVVNPSLVAGPALQDRPTSESFSIVKQMGDGTMRMGAPRWAFGVIDVRDLATAHIAAGFHPVANGRNIISAHETDVYAMSQELKQKYAKYPLPRGAVPKWMAWLMAPMLGGGMTRALVARNFNIPWRADNTKAKRELGLSYRPLRTTMEDMFEQMLDAGMLERKL
ncbi:MAG: NAD-dependent epimerase/dehydratase family protein [Pseudomonadota bacterium]|nr:NAD-dependent epimerase/dehydratase family protein [Pseudomonadota bacterium]